jgi:N-acetylmuramoyl-L-alanine amidase
MAVYPEADWLPISVNYDTGYTAHQGLVIHVAQGFGSLYGYLNNPAAQVSAHFWCGVDGTLEQYVDTDNTAWAEMAGNWFYVSVETEGFGVTVGSDVATPLTDAQVGTLAKLYAWGHETHGWPLQTCDHGGLGLTTHCFYPSGVADVAWGDHPCPGIRVAQIPAILAGAVAIVNPPVNPPPVPSEDTPMIATLVANGNLHTAVVDPTGQLVVTWHRPKGPFVDEPVKNATSLPAQTPALVEYDGAVYVFVIGPNGGQMGFFANPGVPFAQVTV